MWGIGYMGDGNVKKTNGRSRRPRDLQQQKATAASELEGQREKAALLEPRGRGHLETQEPPQA